MRLPVHAHAQLPILFETLADRADPVKSSFGGRVARHLTVG